MIQKLLYYGLTTTYNSSQDALTLFFAGNSIAIINPRFAAIRYPETMAVLAPWISDLRDACPKDCDNWQELAVDLLHNSLGDLDYDDWLSTVVHTIGVPHVSRMGMHTNSLYYALGVTPYRGVSTKFKTDLGDIVEFQRMGKSWNVVINGTEYKVVQPFVAHNSDAINILLLLMHHKLLHLDRIPSASAHKE